MRSSKKKMKTLALEVGGENRNQINDASTSLFHTTSIQTLQTQVNALGKD